MRRGMAPRMGLAATLRRHPELLYNSLGSLTLSRFFDPMATLRKELKARLPLVAVAKDLPPGRRRPGWKQAFLRSLRDAARELPDLSDEQIVNLVRQHRRMRGRPEISVAAKA